MKLTVIYEDLDIIVCEKPAGTPSQSDKTGDMDMVNLVKNYLYETNKKTNPYLGLVHRLDRPVGGVMIFGKTKEATANLSKQIQQSEIDKRYLAVVTEEVSSVSSEEVHYVEDYLVKDGRSNLSKVVTKETVDAKLAKLEYQVLTTAEVDDVMCSLLEVHLLTGRHHQIRVQLSHHFQGIWGDTKYNERFQNRRGWSKIALFSHRLEIIHPKTKKAMVFEGTPKGIPFGQMLMNLEASK